MKKTIINAAVIAGIMAFALQDVQAQWSLTGNAGTNPATNFLGTTDNKTLRIRTNNVVRMSITNNGRVGIGIQAPTSRLEVNGATGTADTVPVISGLVKKTGDFDVVGVQGTSQPAPGFGIGVLGNGNFVGAFGNGGNYGVVGISLVVGVHGEASDVTQSVDLTGVEGITTGGNVSAGVYGTATGAVLNNYGVYGEQQDTAAPYNDFAVVCIGDFFYWGRAFVPSDAKLKNNIQPYAGALDKINQLNTASYTFNHAKYPGMALPAGKQIGFMADNVEQVFPEFIKQTVLPAGSTRDARGKVTFHTIPDVKIVNYNGLIPVLAEAIKEQKAIVDAKDAQIASLASQLATIESRLAALEETSSAKLSSTSLTAASLEQNNPNPFNQSTQIRYSVPANYSTAQIIITSVDGKSVRTYNVTGSGKGQITLNANELSAGTYNYSLNVDGKTVDTKSLVLTK